MTSKEFNRAFHLSIGVMVLTTAYVFFYVILMLKEGYNPLLCIVVLPIALSSWSAYSLYGLKTKLICPQLRFSERLALKSARKNGGDKETARYFKQIWRRSHLVFPMIRELLDDRKTLALKEAATTVSKAPKYYDL